MVNVVVKQMNHSIYLVDYQSFYNANVYCESPRKIWDILFFKINLAT